MVTTASGRLRFVALGGSIVSDWDNPVATSARAVLDAIARAGHEVTFLERRGNPHLAALLANRGSRAYKGFLERYPLIQLRTYDLPKGWQRTVWFGAEIGTADAVIALPGTPDELIPEIAAAPPEHIVGMIDESFAVDAPGLRLVRVDSPSSGDSVAFGPAVALTPLATAARSTHPLVVAYDDAEGALRLADELADASPELIVTGTADLPGWTYGPEIELPERYARAERAFVVGSGTGDWAIARRLLPVASGCATDDGPAHLPAHDDAAQQARTLIGRVHELLSRARTNKR